MSLPKLIKNEWHREPGKPFATARILSNEVHPEGLNVNRYRFFKPGNLLMDQDVGHIISIIQGSPHLRLVDGKGQDLDLEVGVHLYIPPGLGSFLEADTGTELVHIACARASQARGKRLILRNEQFLLGSATRDQSLRWILTSQFLSRRIFLHHDLTLLSKSGNPVSWFRTTMFDVAGLPKNEDGEPVFKMSYNSRTEFNVCYDVKGTSRVRMAQHPYKKAGQNWGEWQQLDGDSTYHLNEIAGGPEEESYVEDETKTLKYLRNKHEVSIVDGYVTLFCLFDPAPTGVECHHPGEYSDYEPLSQVIGTASYETHKREIAKYDSIVDELSLAKAKGDLQAYYGTPSWEQYLQGREAQLAIETGLIKSLVAEGHGREQVLEAWTNH